MNGRAVAEKTPAIQQMHIWVIIDQAFSANYAAILAEKAWSIKDLLCGFRGLGEICTIF